MTLYDYLSQSACMLITRIVVPLEWVGVRVPATVLTVELADVDNTIGLYTGPVLRWSVSTSGLIYEATP